jgi:acyl carrier protein
MDALLAIVNRVRAKKQKQSLAELPPGLSLRRDLGFDSLDLAELTVRIENEFGVDIFADGNVDTIAEISRKLV